MLNKNLTYIYSIEGKDIINACRNYKIKSSKKFKGSLDYSLEVIKLNEINIPNELFYTIGDKQYTKSIVNLTFNYAVKEYREQTLKSKQKIYVRHDFVGDIEDIEFTNGLYIKDNQLLAVMVDKEIVIEKNKFINLMLQIDLPKGFDFDITDNNNLVFIFHNDKLQTIKSTDEIRKDLYINGFKIIYDDETEIRYTRFIRTSGSARVGNCLFVMEDYYNDIMEWNYMGLKFEDNEEIDLAAMESYISLPSSGIIDTIKIDPKSILLIDDFESVFKDDVMVTDIVSIDGKDRLQTQKQEQVEIKNNIWDGQSLLDSGCFVGEYKNKGYLLLRNRFFKSACFNTNIQKFFSDNGITSIDQLNGKTLATDISEIKLITTRSSIKYLKFNTWEEYIDKCTNVYGIVKHEKPTHFYDGEMVQTHYQLLNTLQLSEKKVKELLQPSLDYIRLLKDDMRVFRNHLNIKIKDDIKVGDINSKNELIFAMLQINDKFENTDAFVNFRQDMIDSYVKNIQKGHVLVPGNYSVLFGNPWEMLRATIKDRNHNLYFNRDNPNSVLGIDKVYSNNFSPNTRLLACRSPHISMSAIWLPTNVECPEIKEYFNLTNEIICIDSISNNVLNRMAGADFDSDQILVSDFKLLVDNGLKNKNKFLVPVSKVEGEKTKRKNTLLEKAELDIKTSVNCIGEIINFSQVLNSYLWHLVNSGEDIDSEKIKEIYKDICKLDIMSRIEIDMAKKEFTIDNKLELRELKKKYNIKKPKFLYYISKLKSNKYKPDVDKHKELKTTMDYLHKILRKEMKSIRLKRRGSKGKSMVALDMLLSHNKDIKISNADYHQIDNIIKKCIKLKRECDQIWSSTSLESEEKYIKANNKKNSVINEVSKLKVKIETIKKIITDLAKNPDKVISKENEPIVQYRSIQVKLLSILYKAHPDKFISLFEKNIADIPILVRVNTVPKGVKVIKIYHMDYIIIKDQFTDFWYLTG